MVRVAELQLLPGASDHDPNTVIPILELVQDMVRRANVDEPGLAEQEQRGRIETATVATANSFVATPEMTEAILSLAPGTTSAVRQSAFALWIALAEEKGMAPTGLGSQDHQRMMVTAMPSVSYANSSWTFKRPMNRTSSNLPRQTRQQGKALYRQHRGYQACGNHIKLQASAQAMPVAAKP